MGIQPPRWSTTASRRHHADTDAACSFSTKFSREIRAASNRAMPRLVTENHHGSATPSAQRQRTESSGPNRLNAKKLKRVAR